MGCNRPDCCVGVGVNGVCDDDGSGRFNRTGVQDARGPVVIIPYHQTK